MHWLLWTRAPRRLCDSWYIIVISHLNIMKSNPTLRRIPFCIAEPRSSRHAQGKAWCRPSRPCSGGMSHTHTSFSMEQKKELTPVLNVSVRRRRCAPGRERNHPHLSVHIHHFPIPNAYNPSLLVFSSTVVLWEKRWTQGHLQPH